MRLPSPAPVKALAFVALLLAGCTHTRSANLTSPAVRAEVNVRAERGHPVLHLEGERGREVHALRVDGDSTYWVDKRTDQAQSAPTSRVHSVAFRRAGIGALEGLGVGFGVGAVLGAVRGSTDGGGLFSYSPGEGAWVVGVMGAAAGALAGAARSNRFVYVSVTPFEPLGAEASASRSVPEPCAGIPLTRAVLEDAAVSPRR